MLLRRKLPPPTIQSMELPAPVGGLNALAAATALPPTDCLALYNMTAAELGLRVRQGWTEWAVGLTGGLDTLVRTIMPFQGSHKNGSTDKLFACTSSGIWDVTSQGGATTAWTITTAYQTGSVSQAASFVTNGGNAYVCIQGGTSAGAGGPTGTGTSIADGTCVWNYVSGNVAPSRVVTFSSSAGDAGYGTFFMMPNGVTGDHSLLYCDEENGYYVYSETSATWAKVTLGGGGSQISGVDPATFAGVTVWKNRVWFVQKDTSVAWYLSTNAIYGAATAFDFGPRMRAGGPLTNLFSWSYDAGSGMDTLLVGISTGGDVVLYQGTDPSSASTFSIKGSWTVGGVPYGRKIATEFGGELLIMSLRGVVQLSKLVVGAPAAVGKGDLYDSDKIAPLFNLDAQSYYTARGWEIGDNPGDNALMCLVPANGSGGAAKLYVMSQSNQSWSIYRDLPMTCRGTWNGVMYFGTPDGRIAKVGGYVDAVLIGNTSSYSTIHWSLLTGFADGGTVAMKQVQSIIPMLEVQEPSPPINAEAKYDLDITEAAEPAASNAAGSGTWDHATWDSSTWGGAYQEIAPIIGAAGMGRNVGIAVRGQAASRSSLVGIGVLYTVGGFF